MNNPNPNVTRLTLIERVKNTEDEHAWREFVEFYRNVILRWATLFGCSPAMAEDVYQETMISLIRTLPNFDYSPKRGRFRSFLKTLVSRRVTDAFRREGKYVHVEGWKHDDENTSDRDPFDELLNDHKVSEAEVDRVWLQSIVAKALKETKESVDPLTYKSFIAYVIKEEPVTTVCETLGISGRGTVYEHKSRFLRSLTKTIDQLLDATSDAGFCEKLLGNKGAYTCDLESMVKDCICFEDTMLEDKKQTCHLEKVRELILSQPMPDDFDSDADILLVVRSSGAEWVPIKNGETTFGRHSDVTIILDGQGVSGIHAKIYLANSGAIFEDLQSTNGSRVNGRIESHRILCEGDCIQVAENLVVYLKKRVVKK